MAESAQQDIEHDEASKWYADLRESNLRQVEAQLNEISSAHAQLENTWSTLDEKENGTHEQLDTRTIVTIQTERQRLLNEASQLQQGYAALQAQKQHLETNSNPRFEELMAATKDNAGQIFLTVHKAKLQDPAAVKNLMYAHSRAASYGIRPGSNAYYKALEASMGWDESDRSPDELGLSDEMRQAKNATKRDTPERQEPKELTQEQVLIARDLGITSDEYAASMKNPFSQASQAISDESKEAPIEVKLEPEKPTRKAVDPTKYKPGPQSMTLSPAQVKFCQDSGIDPKEYVKSALEVNSGRSNHQWYEQRLKSQGLA